MHPHRSTGPDRPGARRRSDRPARPPHVLTCPHPRKETRSGADHVRRHEPHHDLGDRRPGHRVLRGGHLHQQAHPPRPAERGPGHRRPRRGPQGGRGQRAEGRRRRPHVRVADPPAGLLDLARAAPDRHHRRGRRQEPHQDRHQGVDQLQGPGRRGGRAPRGPALPVPAGHADRDHQGVARGLAALHRRRHDDRADHLRPQGPVRPRRRVHQGRPLGAGPAGRPAQHLRHLDAGLGLPVQPRPRRVGARPPGRRGLRGRGAARVRVRRHRGGRADRRAPEGPRPQARRDQGRHRPRERRGRGRGSARARRAGPPRRAAGARGARRAGARHAGAPRHRDPQARRGQGVRRGPGGERAS